MATAALRADPVMAVPPPDVAARLMSQAPKCGTAPAKPAAVIGEADLDKVSGGGGVSGGVLGDRAG